MPETVPCNLCGNTDVTPQPEKVRFLRIPEPLGICRCPRCGLLYLNPRPTAAELDEMYHTHPYYSAENATRGAARGDFYDARMERLEHWNGGVGTLLGVGFSDGGYALAAAQARGWKVVGVECSRILVEHARTQLGLDVRSSPEWELSGFRGSVFDAVYSHNMEHVLDPRGILRQCRSLLKEDGLLLLEVPNQFYALKDKVKRLMYFFMGSRARRYLFTEVAPEFHTYFFDPHSIRKVLASEGFEILEFRTYLRGHPTYLTNPLAGWLQEAVYAIGGLLERGPCIEVLARPRNSSAGD